MTDSGSSGFIHMDSATMERFLTEWGMKIQDPTPDEEAEVIASRLRLKEKKQNDGTRHQVP